MYLFFAFLPILISTSQFTFGCLFAHPPGFLCTAFTFIVLLLSLGSHEIIIVFEYMFNRELYINILLIDI